MIENYYSSPEALEDLRSPPLGAHTESFCNWLEERTYPRTSIRGKLCQIRALSQWMQAKGLELRQLNERIAQRFVSARRRRGIGGNLNLMRPTCPWLTRTLQSFLILI